MHHAVIEFFFFFFFFFFARARHAMGRPNTKIIGTCAYFSAPAKKPI